MVMILNKFVCIMYWISNVALFYNFFFHGYTKEGGLIPRGYIRHTYIRHTTYDIRSAQPIRKLTPNIKITPKQDKEINRY